MSVSVKAVIQVDGRVPLLLNERDEWELPGGRMEAGETIVDAIVREVREELGLTVRLTGILGDWEYQPAGSDATVTLSSRRAS